MAQGTSVVPRSVLRHERVDANRLVLPREHEHHALVRRGSHDARRFGAEVAAEENVHALRGYDDVLVRRGSLRVADLLVHGHDRVDERTRRVHDHPARHLDRLLGQSVAHDHSGDALVRVRLLVLVAGGVEKIHHLHVVKRHGSRIDGGSVDHGVQTRVVGLPIVVARGQLPRQRPA